MRCSSLTERKAQCYYPCRRHPSAQVCCLFGKHPQNGGNVILVYDMTCNSFSAGWRLPTLLPVTCISATLSSASTLEQLHSSPSLFRSRVSTQSNILQVAAMPGTRALLLCVLGVSSFIGLGLWRHRIDFVLWGGRIFLTLCLLTLIISVVTPWVSSSRVPVPSNPNSVPEDEVEKLQRLARKEQQDQLSRKASSYMEKVLKPRQDLKLKKQEERFYRMTGQTWKLTEGQRLGEVENSTNNCDDKDTGFETANDEAIRKRKLPENVTKPVVKTEQPQPKKVIHLPEEPSELEEGVVTVALRCPSGRVFRRRFYKSCSSLVLQDWMMKIGYHSVIYTLSTPFPRCQLQLETDLTLEQVGIVRDTALNVEEKDQS